MILDVAGAVLQGIVLTGLIAAASLRVDRASFAGAPLSVRLRYVARTRWPYLVIVGAILSSAVAVQLLPDPRGHWSDHAMTSYNQLTTAIAIVVTCALVRRFGPALLVVPVLVVGLGIAAWGNWQVAESLWKTSYGDDDISESVAHDPVAFVSGHDTAGSGDTIVWFSGMALVALAGITKKVGPRTAVLGGVLAVLPPWLFGGIGPVVVIARAAVVQRRDDRPPPLPTTGLVAGHQAPV